MTWARFSDDFDETTAYLGADAFRLYACAITYCRRNERAGLLHRQRDVAPLAAKLRIRRLDEAIAELAAEVNDDEPLWLREGDYFVIRHYEVFNPPTSRERTRLYRAARMGGHGDAAVTSQAVTGDAGSGPSDVASRERPSAGSPVPDPIPVPVALPISPGVRVLSSGVGTHDGFLDGPDLDSIPAVKAWGDAARAAGKPLSVIGAGMLEIERQLPQHRDVPEDILIAACRRAGGKGFSSGLYRDINAVMTERARSGSTIRDRHLALAAELEGAPA